MPPPLPSRAVRAARTRRPRVAAILALILGSAAGLAAAATPPAAGGARFRDDSAGYQALIRRHYDRMMEVGTDRYGPKTTDLWLAAVDVMRGGQPERPDPAIKRTYREIHAPRGSNLYWEQPAVIAALQLSQLTGDGRYAAFAERYLRDFLRLCVSEANGLFLWGNHLYYDVFTDQIVGFSGSHFETRPLPVAWDLFWRISPAATERCIRTMGVQYVLDPKTGYFDRHASIKATTPPEPKFPGTYPFIESGGVLCESLAWLSAKTGHRDPWLVERALAVARYSFAHRGEKTGLLQNQSGPQQRWDFHAATTESGLWANCLLRSADYTGRQEFADMARAAVSAYLKYGYDAKTGRYFGQLSYVDGTPRKPERTAKDGAETIYQPGEYADLWEPLFPTHNYPMAMAEAALTLHQRTREPQFLEGVRRWAAFIRQSTPANGGQGAYADQYGRCIRFLLRAAHALGEPAYFEQAKALAAEAVGHLHHRSTGMFRSHPGEDRCDAVDGIGLLFLALIYLERGEEYDLAGFGW